MTSASLAARVVGLQRKADFSESMLLSSQYNLVKVGRDGGPDIYTAYLTRRHLSQGCRVVSLCVYVCVCISKNLCSAERVGCGKTEIYKFLLLKYPRDTLEPARGFL